MTDELYQAFLKAWDEYIHAEFSPQKPCRGSYKSGFIAGWTAAEKHEQECFDVLIRAIKASKYKRISTEECVENRSLLKKRNKRKAKK